METPGSEFAKEHVRASLLEDLGGGDVTTRQTIKRGSSGLAGAFSRGQGIACGCRLVEEVYSVLPGIVEGLSEQSPEFNWFVSDGDKIEADQKLFEVEGKIHHLLAGERVALNYLQQLSGVATKTYRMVDIAREFGVKIYDTRKTIPHYRIFQKYAVACGRGYNHRLSLAEAVIIKDNHKLAAGGLKAALSRLNVDCPVIVEIHDPDELDVVLDFDIDVLMLDNMSPGSVKDIISSLNGMQTVEISGGITMDNLKQYCKTGVDRISVGSLTHSFDSLDISFGLIEDE